MPTEHLETSHFELESVPSARPGRTARSGAASCGSPSTPLSAPGSQAPPTAARSRWATRCPPSPSGRWAESRSEAFAVGDIVTGHLGWQESAVVESGREPPTAPSPPGKPSYYLSVLGITGLTAYLGLLEVGQAKAGETVVVSGAAGATGALVGQIAKLRGVSRRRHLWQPEEAGVAHVPSLGFDAAAQLPRRRLPEVPQSGLPRWHRRLLRQRGGDDAGHGTQRDGPPRSHRLLWRRVPVRHDQPVTRSTRSPWSPSRQEPHDARFPLHRLRGPQRPRRSRHCRAGSTTAP